LQDPQFQNNQLKKKKKGSVGLAQAVGRLTSKPEALSSNPSSAKKKERKKERKQRKETEA
jgi:hypothetical protein